MSAPPNLPCPPQLMSLPKSIVQTVVRSTLSLTFVIAAARVVFNIKGRCAAGSTWLFCWLLLGSAFVVAAAAAGCCARC